MIAQEKTLPQASRCRPLAGATRNHPMDFWLTESPY